MGGDGSKTGDERPRPGSPQRPTLGQNFRAGLPMIVGLAICLTTRDATRESLGWWSIVVTIVAAALAAVVTAYLVEIWQRRGGQV